MASQQHLIWKFLKMNCSKHFIRRFPKYTVSKTRDVCQIVATKVIVRPKKSHKPKKLNKANIFVKPFFFIPAGNFPFTDSFQLIWIITDHQTDRKAIIDTREKYSQVVFSVSSSINISFICLITHKTSKKMSFSSSSAFLFYRHQSG